MKTFNSSVLLLIITTLAMLFFSSYYVIFNPIVVQSNFEIVLALIGLVLPIIFTLSLFKVLKQNLKLQNYLRLAFKSTYESPVKRFTFNTLFSILILSLTVLTHKQHDYTAYEWQWNNFLLRDGTISHAYGPLFNLLAFIHSIYSLSPKLLFCIVWLTSCFYLFNIVCKKYLDFPLITLSWFLFIFANPFFWIFAVKYGSLDMLAGGTCLAAMILRSKSRSYLAGFILGIGALFKYYPLIIFPFLMINDQNKKLDLRLGVSSLGTFIVGTFISYLAWGSKSLEPILFASQRRGQWFSIFRFLDDQDFSPLRLISDNLTTYKFSSICMLVFISFVLIWSWIQRVDDKLAPIIGLLTALTFHRTGYPQYYTPIFMMIPFWYTKSTMSKSIKSKIFIPIGILLLLMVVGTMIYDLLGSKDLPWIYVFRLGGLPTFIIAIYAIISSLYYGCLRKKLF